MLEEILPGLAHAPNTHPMFVHFPIALWAAAGLFLFLGMVRQREDMFIAGRWLLYIGAIGAAVAIGTGLRAADVLGHDSPGHELVHVHRDLMLAASGLGLVATLGAAALRDRENVTAKWGVTLLALATIGVLTLGADRGAALVFQHGVGVADGPEPSLDSPHVDDHDASHDHSHDSR